MTKLVQDPILKIQNLSAIEVERIEPIDIMRILRVIWHGKLSIIFTTILAIVAAGYYAFAIATPRYAATTTLQIVVSSEQSLNGEQTLAGLPNDLSGLKTEIAILQSRHLLAQVVADMNLLEDPAFNRYLTDVPAWSKTSIRNSLRSYLSGVVQAPPDDAAILDKTIDNLANTISVAPLRDTSILQITATTGNRRTSAQVTDKLAEVYLADQATAAQAATEQTFGWLSERVFDLQITLEAKETAINDMITANQADDADILEALSRQSIETRERLSNVQHALNEAEGKLANFDDTLTTTPTGKARLLADIDRFKNQMGALTSFQTDIEARLANQSASSIQLQQLRRETDATRVLYETFLARLQETSVQRGLQHIDSRILTKATPGNYVAPRKTLIMLMAAILGATVGVSAIFVRQMLRRGFISADNLSAATQLPVFAQIPNLNFRKPAKILDYLGRKPNSAAAEAIRNLRTSLLLAQPSKTPQVILSTSSIAGEGKTTQSIGLAHNLAGLGKSVLLIEADARQPAFSKYFNGTGYNLGQIIHGKVDIKDAISSDPRLTADILMARAGAENPADQFSSPAFAAFIEKLRGMYDFIIVDAPPVLPVPDARILAQHSDAILYAVRWDKTDKRLIRAGQSALGNVNADITGLVLTQVNMKQLRRYGQAHLADYGHAYCMN